MAIRAGPGDLQSMYTSNADNPKVRDRRSRYVDHDPDRERYPAELVLRDLRTRSTEETAPLIVARYTALRAWLMGTAGPQPAFLEHARQAAAAHLDSAPVDWPEGALLRRLVRPGGCEDEASTLLAEVAGAAESLGHLDGALAAWSAAFNEALRTGRFDLAAGLARRTAGFLRRCGAPERAASWERASLRLARAGGSAPPSES